MTRPIYPLIGLLALVSSALQAQSDEVSFKTTELEAGLYMIEGVGGFAGGNMALSVGADGVVLIDDSLPPLTEQLLATIGEITDESVDFVINTHLHGDHIGGNEALQQQGATIVAHDNVRQRLTADGIRTASGEHQPAPSAMLPVLTFSQEMTFHLNGHRARVFHVHHAHTDGDAVIHFPELDLIHTGDTMFNGLFPFIDLDSGGSVDGYIAAQEQILALTGEQTRIIPGHGPMATRQDLADSVAMLKQARERIAALHAAGKSQDEVLAEKPLEDFAQWSWGFIDADRMAATLYRDLSQEQTPGHAH